MNSTGIPRIRRKKVLARSYSSSGGSASTRIDWRFSSKKPNGGHSSVCSSPNA
jgi:hypothetical protein